MSKNSPFASFADAAEPTRPINDIYNTKNEQLTIRELIKILQTIVRKDPSAIDTLVWHEEFGSMMRSTTVTRQDENIIISR
jgi:hypothetical protein